MVEVRIPMLVFFNFLRRKPIPIKSINVFVFIQSSILNSKSPFPLDIFDDRIGHSDVRYFPGNCIIEQREREEKPAKLSLCTEEKIIVF